MRRANTDRTSTVHSSAAVPGLVLVSGPLSECLISDSEAFSLGLALGLNGLGIFDTDQWKLSQNCNNAIITRECPFILNN